MPYFLSARRCWGKLFERNFREVLLVTTGCDLFLTRLIFFAAPLSHSGKRVVGQFPLGTASHDLSGHGFNRAVRWLSPEGL